MLTMLFLLLGLVLFYLLLTLFLTYLVQQIPRNPVEDPPDWGTILDTTIPALDGRSLEVWRIEPNVESRGIVVFAHGWGRNRDRMVGRARMFAQWGFTTVIHSARDHGNSSPKRFMNAARFAEDIEAVLEWVSEPVILYGHSAGSAGAIAAADPRATVTARAPIIVSPIRKDVMTHYLLKSAPARRCTGTITSTRSIRWAR